jgi:hypothetical protein
MTLPLYGTALHSTEFPDRVRSVIRLRSVDSSAPRHVADFALARTPEEVLVAMETKWPSIFVVSDDPVRLVGAFKGQQVAVPSKYNYLADGDILGFDHSSRKFRTLFRRNSAHNSLSCH